MSKRWLAVGLMGAALSCGAARADEGANFSALVEVGGAIVYGQSTDHPQDGFENRFGFLLGGGAPLREFGPARAWVLVRSQRDGTMLVRIDGVCTMTWTPFDEGVKQQFRDSAPGEEDREQTVTIRFEYGFWRVFIEELR